MRSRVEVVMDQGGAIGKVGSNKEFFTGGFGGCTAICAQTDPGMYGLYHLRSTLDAAPDMVPEALDSNEPFRKWIQDLKEQSQGETIHFKIGTPRNYSNRSFSERHPEVGMERYIRKLCALYGIQNYDIKLMNMVGVEGVSVTEKGLTCYYGRDVTEISEAEYQTDEEIFEHSDWTNEQCLNNIKSFPNIDYDGKLLEKYQQRYDIEQQEKEQKALDAKQKEMVDKQRELKNQRGEMVQAIKEPMLITLTDKIKEYQAKFEHGPKEDLIARFRWTFLEKLHEAVQSGNLSSLEEMKKEPYFKHVTEIKMPFFFKNEQSEIGKIFYKAETLLNKIQELYPEESLGFSSKAEI